MKKRARVLALLLAAVMTVSGVPATALAADGVRPADGTTKEQPFTSGTGDSQKFRIPCLVSLDDGTIVAGCDARWNTHMDGGGLDTIVSKSDDKGQTWDYTFANYLGDNGNTHNGNSTAFIDPAMATDGETVYMIADLFPAGYALNGATNSPVAGKSHDKDGNILLADAREWSNCWVADRKNADSYTYHLEKNTKKNADSAYIIKDQKGNEVEGYTVDAYFNIKGENVNTNLFEADSPFQVWPTDYLYLTTSDDGGETWSVPTIINARKENEQTLLVGPGRGMVTSKGRILFTAYEFTNGDKNSAAIYSDDGGKTWERGASVEQTSSEAVVTEADGKLYMFTRHGGYNVSSDWGKTWSEKKNMGINYCQTCQLTAVTYPEKIDGKTAILFAAPSATDRSAGKIFVGLVEADGTLNWKYNFSINGSAYYAYSCLTVLPDGTVGLLYENAGSAITYVDFDIEDIAKGAAIGNIWCTDAENNLVSELTMQPEQTKELTLNGLASKAEVKVTSDNEDAVTAVYENGKVQLTSKAVTGMKRASVTIEAGNASTTLNVNVTDQENHEIVNLRVGDTATYVDETGNYSDQELTGLDTKVAEVTMTGQDEQAVEKQAKAKLATADSTFDGDEVSLDDCTFRFLTVEEGQKAPANTYTITGQDGETSVYVGVKNVGGGRVSSTTETPIQLEWHEDGTVSLKDVGTGDASPYLYFWRDNKGYFDRFSTDDAACHMELYQKSANASANSAIPGYKKVTAEEIVDGGDYLIAAKANDGTYYVAKPSAANERWKHVAKVVAEDVAIKEELAVALGTTKDYNDGGEKKISSCLFTFEEQPTEGNYKIYATTEDGQKVYLGPKSGASGKPLVTTEEEVTVTAVQGEDEFTFEQKANGTGGGYLYFWKTDGNDSQKFRFDKNSSRDGSGKCDFELYKKAESADVTSGISGYEKITAVDQIEEGGQYLIVAKVASDNTETYYLLNPSTGNNNYNYVAKVTDHNYKEETVGAKTDITITAVGEGQTSVTIGEKTYYIFVENDVEEVILEVGDTYNVPGEILNKEEIENSGVVSVEKQAEMPPYKAISEMKEGTYLFGTATHIMTNSPVASTGASDPNGLALKAVNFNVDETAKDFMWKVTKSGEGYTMQDVASQKYVHIEGQNVTLADEQQVLTISARQNGGFAVASNGHYLNNWQGTSKKIAAWTGDDLAGAFYAPSEGYVATAAKVGTQMIKTDGNTNYEIIVREKAPEVHEFTVNVSVNHEEMGTATLSPKGPTFNEGTEVTATATVKDAEKYEFVNWTVDGEEVSKEKAYTFTVEANKELVANFKAKEVPVEKFVVTATVNDDKMGTATLDPEATEGKYEAGTEVTAKAEAKEGYEFVNWTVGDDVVSTDATYTFEVDAAKELVANFKAKEVPAEKFTVTATVNDADMGTATLSPEAPKDGYVKGTEVTATATVKDAEKYEFVNWTVNGKEVSKEKAYTFTVEANKELVANFKVKEVPVEKFVVTATVNDDKMGTATLDPESTEGKYEAGTEVTAKAEAKEGYEFVNWTVDGKEVSNKAEYKFTVDADKELVANFKAKEVPVEKFVVTATVNNDKMGTATLDPEATEGKYEAGTEVTATAKANEGYEFVNWTVDGKEVSKDAEYKFTVDKAMDLKANFKKTETTKPTEPTNPETPNKPDAPKEDDKAVQTGDHSASPIIPAAGLILAAGAAVAALRKKED